MNLNIPFVVETYWHLKKNGLVSDSQVMPRTRSELLAMISRQWH